MNSKRKPSLPGRGANGHKPSKVRTPIAAAYSKLPAKANGFPIFSKTAQVWTSANPGFPNNKTSLWVTLVILIPRFYNPDTNGLRAAVEPQKIAQTIREMQQQFSGYSRSHIEGWYRDDSTQEECSDQLIRFEVDLLIDRPKLEALSRWKKTLELRFRQRSIYFKFMAAVLCWI